MQGLLSASLPLLKGVYAGGNLRILHSSVAVSEGEVSGVKSAASALTFDLGMYAILNDQFEMGVSARGLNGPELKFGAGTGMVEARTLDAGVRFNFLKDFHILAETELVQDRPVGFRFGADLVFFKVVSVRAGIDRDGLFTLGAGLNLSYISLDLAMAAHPDLGNIVQADISSRF
jgi:hypothetical protein